jgi:uncharacterized protein YneF (UPF0154 family)
MKAFIKILIIFLGITFVIGCYLFNKKYHENIRNHPKKFIYETINGPANPVLIIEDLSYKDSLINYYKKLESRPKNEPFFNFPLKTIPTNDPVYLINMSDDGQLGEFVSYYDRVGIFGGSFLRGWTYINTIHDNPPK